MRDIALAIMVVGLCFYEAYNKKVNGDYDWVISIICVMAALHLLLS